MCVLFETVVLETPKGEEQLKDFVKLRLFSNAEDGRGKGYTDFARRMFDKDMIPLYAVINPEGEMTAFESNVLEFDVTSVGAGAGMVKKFQEFLDTTKGRGEPFDFDRGFLPPKDAPRKADTSLSR